MTLIKNYNYSESDITFLTVDNANGQYIWIGFAQDASGNCALKKVSANNPLQTYFSIDIATTEIKKGYVFSSYIYLALDDASLIGKRYSLLNPLTVYDSFSLPAGITEAPIDILVSGLNVYFLIPGSISGSYAKVCIFSLAGVFSETVNLSTVNDANTMTIDGNGDLWVATDESPSSYVRVYQTSGGVYTYSTFS